TTPSAALRWLRDFLLMPQPPLLHKEGNVPLQALPAGRRDRLDRIHIDAIARRRSDDDAFHLDLLADVRLGIEVFRFLQPECVRAERTIHRSLQLLLDFSKRVARAAGLVCLNE